MLDSQAVATILTFLHVALPDSLLQGQDLLKQLRLFLAGASTGNTRGNTRLAQTALHLLVHLPAARSDTRDWLDDRPDMSDDWPDMSDVR